MMHVRLLFVINGRCWLLSPRMSDWGSRWGGYLKSFGVNLHSRWSRSFFSKEVASFVDDEEMTSTLRQKSQSPWRRKCCIPLYMVALMDNCCRGVQWLIATQSEKGGGDAQLSGPVTGCCRRWVRGKRPWRWATPAARSPLPGGRDSRQLGGDAAGVVPGV